jgi:ABC-type sulfate/molybdate transport systems ATPase subunit
MTLVFLLSILGESGAGKTTILRIIEGLLTPDTRSVIIKNYNYLYFDTLTNNSLYI